MTDDSELLRRYHETHSESAFAELVERHLPLVYNSALRQLGGDRHRAQDVSQMVFIDLARKAGTLIRHPLLAGWLYRSTRFAAAQVRRVEARRNKREQNAQTMHDLLTDPTPPADWGRLRPVIDEVVYSLPARDQQVVFLRFFSGQPYAMIGARLGLTAEAARFRADRALEKMRHQLAKRGVESTAAALALALTAQACPAVPVGLAATVSGGALAGATASSLGTFFQLMLTSKQAALVGTLVAIGGTVAFTENVKQRALRREIASLTEQNRELAQASAENVRLQAQESKLRATASAQPSSVRPPAIASSQPAASPSGKITNFDQTPVVIDRAAPAYPADLKATGLHPTITVDFIVDTSGNVRNAYALGPVQPSKTGTSGTEALEDEIHRPKTVVTMMSPYNPTDAPATTEPPLSPEAQAEFNEAAVRAVSQWVFVAGNHTGRTVNTHMQAPVTFSLPEAFVPPTR